MSYRGVSSGEGAAKRTRKNTQPRVRSRKGDGQESELECTVMRPRKTRHYPSDYRKNKREREKTKERERERMGWVSGARVVFFFFFFSLSASFFFLVVGSGFAGWVCFVLSLRVDWRLTF